jgi:hypothetical protein
MLRITCIERSGSSPLLKLEGKLLEPWIPELLKQCSHAGDTADFSSFDLSELFYADQAGVRALRALIDRGYKVTSCSSFIADLLQLERS